MEQNNIVYKITIIVKTINFIKRCIHNFLYLYSMAALISLNYFCKHGPGKAPIDHEEPNLDPYLKAPA